MGAVSPRGLADHLRTLDDGALVALLRARPDLAVPTPTDLSVLATRAQVRLSVARAMETLDLFTLEVLDAVRLAPSVSGVLALVGDAVPADRVRAALDRLRSLVLVWGPDDALHVLAAVADTAGPYPAALGRSLAELLAPASSDQLAPVLDALHLPPARQPVATEALTEALSDPVRVRALTDTAPPEARAVLERLAAGPPLGALRGARRAVAAVEADSPVRWLLAHGLLAATGDDTVELPREIGLVVRGDRPLGPLHPDPPGTSGRVLTTADVDAAGAGQVLEVVRLAETLLEAAAAETPGVLRSGGLGVRELRRLARIAAVTEPVAALLLEVTAAAGLLGQTGEVEPEWLPTPAYDVWRTDDAAGRWAVLATAWLRMTRLPRLIGQRDDRDRLLGALAPEIERTGAPATRRAALGALAHFGPGTAAPPEDVVAAVDWASPRRRGRGDALGWALEEAATLGLTGRGALTSFGRALLAGDPAADLLRKLLPEPLDHVLVQPDLTVVAPGPLEPDLATELGLVADVESAGAATVYRVTAGSVRRALDAGRTAGDLHTLFAARSRTPIPQSLTYLIDDTARRHGGLRVGGATAYLRSDDEALLAGVLADRRNEALRLRRLAPTVLVSTAPVNRLLEVLRDGGYAPVAEDASGGVVLTRTDERRAVTARRSTRPAAGPPVLDDERLAQVVRAARTGDAAARESRRSPVSTTHVPGVTTATTLAILQTAARARSNVWLGYVDAHGGTATRKVRPVSVGAGYLRAEDDRTEVLHTFALHRITSAAPVEE
ncbi:MAG TPA: helicase-associated domain-containing protein [Mycobacteriales bacterium]